MSAVNIGQEDSQDVELNIAPIIDCFVVLITFLLISSSFLALGILDAGIAAAGKSATPSTPPPVQITIEMTGNHVLQLKLNGASHQTYALPAKEQNWNYDALTERLNDIKKKWPSVSAVTLTASQTTEYKDIVQTMEMTRKVMPNVLLGGF